MTYIMSDCQSITRVPIHVSQFPYTCHSSHTCVTVLKWSGEPSSSSPTTPVRVMATDKLRTRSLSSSRSRVTAGFAQLID